MNNTRKTVALISGGMGCEHDVSVQSAKNLSGLIDRSRYEVLDVFIDRDGAWYIREGGRLTPTFPTRLGDAHGFIYGTRIIGTSVAIPCLHGELGEDGNVQGALTLAGISYVGEDVYASAAAQDKIYTKLCAESLGIPTAPFVFFDGEAAHEARAETEARLGYPVIIKPARLGSSHGIKIARCAEEFGTAYAEASAYSGRLLVEALIDLDHELECAYLLGRYAPYGRVLSGGGFYGYEEKYGGGTPTEISRGKAPETERRASEYAKALVHALGIRTLSRIDFLVTSDGKLYFNEINAFPGMTDTSLFPRLTEEMSLKRGEFIDLLIEDAIS